MTFSVIINLLCLFIGVLCCLNGYLIWKKQNLKFLNNSNYARVKLQDIPAYSKSIGLCNILIGISVIFMGVYNQYFESMFGVLVYMVVMGLGFFIGIKAQLKYNGSII